jgi:hypothetical protein
MGASTRTGGRWAAASAVALALAATGCAGRVGALTGRGEPAYVAGVDVRVRAEMRAGPVTSGYVQTPKGGQPGTTSPKRPTFDELDADTTFAPSADLRFAFGRQRTRTSTRRAPRWSRGPASSRTGSATGTRSR